MNEISIENESHCNFKIEKKNEFIKVKYFKDFLNHFLFCDVLCL